MPPRTRKRWKSCGRPTKTCVPEVSRIHPPSFDCGSTCLGNLSINAEVDSHRVLPSWSYCRRGRTAVMVACRRVPDALVFFAGRGSARRHGRCPPMARSWTQPGDCTGVASISPWRTYPSSRSPPPFPPGRRPDQSALARNAPPGPEPSYPPRQCLVWMGQVGRGQPYPPPRPACLPPASL